MSTEPANTRGLIGSWRLRMLLQRDLGLALFWVATDPESKTPGRVLEAGPWWWVLRTDARSTVPEVRAPACPDHPAHPATACPDCAASITPPPANWRTPREDQPA